MSKQGPPENNRQSRKQREEYVRNLSQATDAIAKKRKIEEQIQHRQNRRRIAYVLFVVGCIVAASHVLTHAGALTIIANEGLADLAIGYPTAGLLILAGLMLLPAQKY